MANLSGIATLVTTLPGLSNLILVTPQSTKGFQPLNPNTADGLPSQAQPPKAYVFDYEGEQAVALESDITDHYVENNISVADQIALKPELVNTFGYIGELNDVLPDFLAARKIAADKLLALSAYEPAKTTTALIALNRAVFAYQAGRNAINALASSASSLNSLISEQSGQGVIGPDGFIPGGVQNKQQTAYQTWYGYWRTRTLFNVQTPWAVFQNMAIKSLRAIQDADTAVVTGFEIQFKMIRTAQSVSTSTGFANGTFRQGRAIAQSSSNTSLGTSSPAASSVTVPSAVATTGG